MDLTLPIALPRARPPWRALAGALITAGLLLASWLWLRDSSLVSVSDVRISGASGAQAAQIEQLLRATAKRMTTMDFDARALRAAVSGFPVVSDVRASTGFPHSVRIEVLERSPIATLLADGQRTALSADGTALGPQLASGALPALSGSLLPVAGQRVIDGSAREALSAIAAAPPALGRLLARAFAGREGLTLQMRNGLLVYFGNATRPHAKWLSLARVLADRGSAGTRYVDVRIPERPAAGLASASSTLPAGSQALPTAALAERLEQAYGGGSRSATSARAGEAASGSEASSEASASRSGSEASASRSGSEEASTSPREAPPGGGESASRAATARGETGAAQASSGGTSPPPGAIGKG